MQNLITILMDDRERSTILFQELSAMDGVNIQVQRLPLGDFQVDDRLLFERKRLPDFALSVIDGRFFKQMRHLADSALKGVLILEGGSHDLKNSGMRREALQGALVCTSLILGIPVLRALDTGETARLIVYAARQARLAVVGGVGRLGRRPKGRRKRQLYLLQGLPGVGPMRAALLLSHFGSVRNVFNASVDALISVDGVGTNIARCIDEAVGEKVLAWGNSCEDLEMDDFL